MFVGDRYFRTVNSRCFDPVVRIAEMDATGVDVQVVRTVPILFSYEKSIEPAAELSRYLNNDITSVCLGHPRRFVGLSTSVTELRRAKPVLGLKSVEAGTEINRRALDGLELTPFWTVCKDLDVPIFFHPLGYELERENNATGEITGPHG